MEIGLKELAEVITLRLKEKGCPTGSTLQRLACYLIQALDKQASFLREEAIINYEIAFSAFYQTFPYGRFAHFTANSVILEAIPEDAEIVHIVDFDIGKGVQWPPIIEALAMQGQRVVVRFTSIKWEEEEGSSYDPPFQSFEETKMLLCEHARYFGLRLKVEERDLVSLDNEMKKTNKRGGGGEWLAFNCMDISGESRALSEVGLVPWRIRKDNLLEAKELVREGESSYYVDIEGVTQNQMVLGYMGTPLVKVSSWR
ncbi:hypothetical protein GH714_002189 [Hevea brasiliensis]|uniref:Uncharacterized protein n=1 Tax=Hevea brasiliensis TaxID=3981 RepID=A0A6A6KVI6_HEVBR|nr:hypothetical protein GH714_002189 [Hevea brasiliensis]